jgi:uncharacterized protein YdaT
MLWTKEAYPQEMEDLRAEIRYKAIALANAKVRTQGQKESRAIREAIEEAIAWADRNHKKIWKRRGSGRGSIS